MEGTTMSAIEASTAKSEMSSTLAVSDRETSSTWLYLLTIGVFILVSIFCFAIFLLTITESDVHETTVFDKGLELSDSADKSEITIEPPGEPVTRPRPLKKETVATRRMQPTPAVARTTSAFFPTTTTRPITRPITSRITRTSRSTPPTITPAITTTAVPEAIPAPSDTIVCTVSNMVRPETSALPPDGYCDLLFYESFYKDDKNILADGYATLEPNARHFVDQASSVQRTMYGASFAFTKTFSKAHFMSQKFFEGIHDLWNRKVYHFGFLNLYREFSAPEVVKDALLTLKEIYIRLNRRRRPSYEVLGLSLDFPTLINDTAFYISTVFVPSLFIAIGHLSYSDASFPNCIILPPNIPFFVRRPENPTYGHEMRESLVGLRIMNELNPLLSLSLSVGLSGRYYAPSPRYASRIQKKSFGPFSNCKNFSGPRYDDPANVCPNATGGDWKILEHTSLFFYTSVYNERLKRTLSFDTAKLIQEKVCGSKSNFTDVHFSLAAYDVDFDSSPEACEEIGINAGAFNRLSFIRPFSNYVLRRYTDIAECDGMNYTTNQGL